MTLFTAFVYCIAGLFLLYWCGNKLVDGAVGIAKKFNISPMFIGIAIIGMGTSLPEVISTVTAAHMGKDDIAVGNIIGSNIANLGIVLGLALLLMEKFKPTAHHRREYWAMLLATVTFSVCFIAFGKLGFWIGLFFLFCMLAYLWGAFKFSQKTSLDKDLMEEANPPQTLLVSGLCLGAGFIGLFLGAHLMVEGASHVARFMGISERVIGLTLVAIGTSLPEIAATIAAARQKQVELILGNVAGSNIFNVMAAGGAAAITAPIVLHPAIIFDLASMLIISVFALVLFYRKLPRCKVWGVFLISIYGAYLFMLGAG